MNRLAIGALALAILEIFSVGKVVNTAFLKVAGVIGGLL